MKFISTVRKTVGILTAAEGFCTVVLVFGLIVLSLVQIVMRNFFESSINWIDPLLRHAVLWIAFFAASAATASGKHIKIDLFPRLVSARVRRIIEPIADLICCAVCAVAGWHSYLFVADEKMYGGDLFDGAPVWFFEIIMPAGFFLLAVHFLLNIPLISGQEEQTKGEAN